MEVEQDKDEEMIHVKEVKKIKTEIVLLNRKQIHCIYSHVWYGFVNITSMRYYIIITRFTNMNWRSVWLSVVGVVDLVFYIFQIMISPYQQGWMKPLMYIQHSHLHIALWKSNILLIWGGRIFPSTESLITFFFLYCLFKDTLLWWNHHAVVDLL